MVLSTTNLGLQLLPLSKTNFKYRCAVVCVQLFLLGAIIVSCWDPVFWWRCAYLQRLTNTLFRSTFWVFLHPDFLFCRYGNFKMCLFESNLRGNVNYNQEGRTIHLISEGRIIWKIPHCCLGIVQDVKEMRQECFSFFSKVVFYWLFSGLSNDKVKLLAGEKLPP